MSKRFYIIRFDEIEGVYQSKAHALKAARFFKQNGIPFTFERVMAERQA